MKKDSKIQYLGRDASFVLKINQTWMSGLRGTMILSPMGEKIVEVILKEKARA